MTRWCEIRAGSSLTPIYAICSRFPKSINAVSRSDVSAGPNAISNYDSPPKVPNLTRVTYHITSMAPPLPKTYVTQLYRSPTASHLLQSASVSLVSNPLSVSLVCLNAAEDSTH